MGLIALVQSLSAYENAFTTWHERSDPKGDTQRLFGFIKLAPFQLPGIYITTENRPDACCK